MITDTFLNELATVINGGTMDVPSHIGFTSTALTLSGTDTSMSGEFGNRVSVSGTRVLSNTTFGGLRGGAVASSSGDTINAIGLFDASTTGDLYAEALVPSVIHTSTFDFEIDWGIRVSRK